ncbi:TDP-N-acetylfucosamine:lipid II N-acetylfucosaminyltransferase [Ramlibacter sp. PS3R-8]|uniref:TDP-N-acetylfucosamine:lipid II N-acetylfucosaminyltransferase n=1 Tax=Ramlibacter sp. PS3R-8 TaxID=3133437 RepID=UPI0030A698D5
MSRDIVHLCVQEKFIQPFVQLVREQFGLDRHLFLVAGKGENFRPAPQDGVVSITGIGGRLRALGTLYQAKKIILHGLYDAKFLYLLALQPWLLPKCHWMVWGDDLYRYLDTHRSRKGAFKERVRRFVIRRIGHIVTYIPGDYELVKQWYGSRAAMVDCLMYMSNVYQPLPDLPASDGSATAIQVGNSAYPRNLHVEALERIAPFRDQDIEVYAPLSYGPKPHAQAVAAHGRALLGDRFFPLLDFLDAAGYRDFLAKIDIAVFNNTRQQAMGNIISLLGMGKTLYLRRSTTTWPLLEEIGIRVFDAEQFSLQQLTPAERERNIALVQRHFSRERLLAQLGVLFADEEAA